MNILPRYCHILTILALLLVCADCFPSKHKKAGNHRRTARSHLKGHGHGKKSTKKDSLRPSRQDVMAAVMHPGKLDVREEKELSQLQDFNKEYINNEMAAETSLLASQGIDDDSALRISNIEALPNSLRAAYTSSKTKVNDMKGDSASMSKHNVAAYSPDEYLLDANSWPEYKIKDSDYMNRNYRVYPQGPSEGEGGFQGNMMPYGARGRTDESENEGPYGDGNYGFPQPPHMVSDAQEGPSQMQDQGSQSTSMPMNKVHKVQRLIIKSNNKNPADESFSDLKAGSSNNYSLHSAEGVSGSGEGSGNSEPNPKENKTTLNSKENNDTQITSDMKSNGREKGTGAVVGGKEAAGPSAGGAEGGSGDGAGGANGAGKAGAQITGRAKTSATETKPNVDSSQNVSSHSNPESPVTNTKTHSLESKKQMADKTQNSSSNSKSDSSGKTGQNSSDGAADKPASNGPSAKEITNALSDAQGNSPLGQFAEFLKSKGITLTINKDKALPNSNSNDAPAPAMGDQPSLEEAPNAPPAASMLASVLPSTGVPSAQAISDPNSSTKTNDSPDTQAANVNNAAMNWQNVAPQSGGQIGELFQRQSTKQAHH